MADARISKTAPDKANEYPHGHVPLLPLRHSLSCSLAWSVRVLMPTMKRNPPPPVIDAARVVSYAFVDDIPYFGATPLFAEGERIEPVPRLAIAVGLAGHDGPRVFHCDEEWIALGASGAETVEQAKQAVELHYPGVGERWVDTHVTLEEALAFYDSETAGLKCSFCGKRPFEVEGLIEGPQATICRGCVEEFYSDFQIDDDDELIGN
jgi:hypothetical protein